ncbi:MAG: hypothetical protein ACI9PU_001071 [Ascidiaceihabitans sp.]|jgi:hypothetical protein
MDLISHVLTGKPLPAWVPKPAQIYLAHTEAGLPIRALARMSGCHASTILRQIRKIETRRDDPLVDAALRALGAHHFDTSNDGTAVGTTNGSVSLCKEQNTMSFTAKITADEATFDRDALRILRRLCEKGAVLAVAADMDKAVVVRDGANGSSTRTAVVDRHIAQGMALKNWISPKTQGRITRYQITSSGRSTLSGMLDDTPDTDQVDFAEQHREWGEKVVPDVDTGRPKRMRYNLSESPLTALARRRDKDGSPFLSDELVHVGERLREDFELAQMGPRVAQNWDRFLTAGGRGGFAPDSGVGDGPSAARRRVADAMADLGAGLSDVVLRCCCYLEGLETAEKRLGWSARSGKIVLRIALMRLQQHYERTTGPGGGLIG